MNNIQKIRNYSSGFVPEKKGRIVKMKRRKTNENGGITLIALVVTVIILLILARNNYNNVNRAKWNTK